MPGTLLQLCPLLFLKNCRTRRDTYLLFIFLVLILNTYLVISYLLFFDLILGLYSFFIHHILVMNSLYYPLLLLNLYMFNIMKK